MADIPCVDEKTGLAQEGAIPMRVPSEVMRLSRLGSYHQCRLSFMRILLRRLASEDWQFLPVDWQVGASGVGHAVYTVRGPERAYSLVAFAHDLPDEMRSDRVIATAWDATFTLFDGVPDAADIARLEKNVPYQEAGRISAKELTLSRANRSSRLWGYVVDCLAKGEQPDAKTLCDVGYVMRTTAVYGSGKFGAADRSMIQDREELQAPFQAEMLTVYLIRCFVMDLLDHAALMQGGDKAVPLSRELRQSCGIGNSTGLGMAPFLVNHPALLHCWIAAREAALARVRNVENPTAQQRTEMYQALLSAQQNAQSWESQHPIQIEKISELRNDMALTAKQFKNIATGQRPWDSVYRWARENLTEEGQEQIVSLLLEPYGDLVDGLAECLAIDEHAHFKIDGGMRTDALKASLERCYDFALKIDFSSKPSQARFWYVSEAKLEPRLGERYEEQGAELEQPLCVARDAAALFHALKDDEPVAAFLLRHPEFRHIIRRVQIAQKFPYSEICDNLLHAEMLPIDMLRCKLSFFGATHFDPRSDRWLRICMFQNAPFPEDLGMGDYWAYPDMRGET